MKRKIREINQDKRVLRKRLYEQFCELYPNDKHTVAWEKACEGFIEHDHQYEKLVHEYNEAKHALEFKQSLKESDFEYSLDLISIHPEDRKEFCI